MADLPPELADEPQPPHPRLLRLASVTDRCTRATASRRSGATFDAVSAGEPIGHRHDGTLLAAPGDGFIVFPTRARCRAASGSGFRHAESAKSWADLPAFRLP